MKRCPRRASRASCFKSQKISAADAHVLQAKLSLLGPEADRTLNELVAFMRQNQENAAVHRALAWAFLLRNDMENAVEHIRRALALDDSDPAMHYLYARWVNQGEEDRIRIESAEARMGTELKAALKRDPNYAAALELLGLAELSGGDTKAALANLQRASALCPRSRPLLPESGACLRGGGQSGCRAQPDALRARRRRCRCFRRGRRITRRTRQARRSGNSNGRPWECIPDPNAKHSKYDNLQEAIAEDEKAEARARALRRGTGHAKNRIS